MTGVVRLTLCHQQVAERRGAPTNQLTDLDPETPMHDQGQSRDEPVPSERHLYRQARVLGLDPQPQAEPRVQHERAWAPHRPDEVIPSVCLEPVERLSVGDRLEHRRLWCRGRCLFVSERWCGGPLLRDHAATPSRTRLAVNSVPRTYREIGPNRPSAA